MIKKKILFFYRKTINYNRAYPKHLAVGSANKQTLNLCKKIKPKYYCEIGFHEGHTLKEVLKILPNEAKIDIFDFQDKCDKIKNSIPGLFKKKIKAYGNSYKFLDNYNNSLYKVWIKNKKKPLYDYIFLDGSHVFTVDCLTFFLADKLLKKGGIIDLDDFNWSIKSSPSMNPDIFKASKLLYSSEQINQKGVKMIIDGFIKNSPLYKEIIKNKAYKKI